ncbi:MAG: hypothetical protein WCG14_06765 [Chlamydiia bacterium]
MIPQTLGRFGRLRQTLSEEKNKINAPASQEMLAFKSNQEVVAIPSETSEDFDKISTMLTWLSISLTEGHIEPSQPCVGRIVGWPQRPIFKNSLYVDFECWGVKKDLPSNAIAKRKLFYSLTDRIFISEEDKYCLPSLEECRRKFKCLAQEIYGRAEF